MAVRGRRGRLKRERLQQRQKQDRQQENSEQSHSTRKRRQETETNPTWGHWLGRYGEQAAARYLAAAGYRLLDRNWVCRDPDLRGELDLVARYRRTVVACEVKTRAGDTLEHPAQAVTPQKAQRLRLLAVRWLAEQRIGGAFGAGRGGMRGRPIPLSRSVDSDPTAGGPGLRVDVIAIRTDPRPPFAVRSLDHLIGVA